MTWGELFGAVIWGLVMWGCVTLAAYGVWALLA